MSLLNNDSNKDQTLAAVRTFSINIVAQSNLILHSGSWTAAEMEVLACRVEHLLGTMGHIRRLWPIPERKPLMPFDALENRPAHVLLIALNKLNALVDYLDYPEDVSMELLDEICHITMHIVETADMMY